MLPVDVFSFQKLCKQSSDMSLSVVMPKSDTMGSMNCILVPLDDLQLCLISVTHTSPKHNMLHQRSRVHQVCVLAHWCVIRWTVVKSLWGRWAHRPASLRRLWTVFLQTTPIIRCTSSWSWAVAKMQQTDIPIMSRCWDTVSSAYMGLIWCGTKLLEL